MLPTFHAAGHTAYAKSAQLYLQQMERLESVLPPTDFEKYTNNGYFTVRRTNRFWAGIWTDMTIEQVVMKNLKGRHGVTRGRGITDSTLAYFTSALPACVPIMEAIEELSGVRTESSEQHAQHRDHRDLRPARQKRDADDRMAFVHWLTTHNPFAAQFNKDNRVCSVFSGVSADETINCERAHAIGSILQEKMVGHNFADITMKRSGKVQPLAALTSSVTMKGEPVVIDQQQMLIRCLSIMQSGADLEDFVTYEFVNYAPSLFDNFSMRKTVKSALIQSLGIESHGNENNRSYNMVVDGGHLMHVVAWQIPATYSVILDCYVHYVRRHYTSNTTIVFDGYDQTTTIKSIEQKRRATTTKSSADIEVMLDATTTTTQSEFLANPYNKAQLIKLLSTALMSHDVEVVQAEADADVTIAITALEKASENDEECVAVVSRDTDVLIILIARLDDRRNIVLIQPQPGKADRTYDLYKISGELGPLCEVLLVLHAFTGCDTTSAPFRKGKKKLSSSARESRGVRRSLHIFSQSDPDYAAVAQAGEALFMDMYGVKNCYSLLLYECCIRSLLY